MNNDLKNYLADKYNEGYVLEKDLEKKYLKQLSQNNLIICLFELVKHYEEFEKGIYKRSFVDRENVLEEEIDNFISVLGDNECLKNMLPVGGIDIYHLVLINQNALLIIEYSKLFKQLVFKLAKVGNARFYRYSEYNNFALGELTGLNYKKEIPLTLSFLELDKHLDLIGKSVSDMIDSISLEELLTRYKTSLEQTKTKNKVLELIKKG